MKNELTKADFILDFETLSMGTPSNPAVRFVDEECVIWTEQYSHDNRWRGWLKEILTKKTYFKRKLAGK